MSRLLHSSVLLRVVIGIFCITVALSATETFAQATDSFTIGQQIGIDTEAPTTPTDVSATPIAETQIDVAWTASTDTFGVVGYQVFRDGVQITTVATTNFSDTGLLASTTYSYELRAFDNAGNISSSSVAVATTTLATPPPPPTATSTPVDSGSSGGGILPLAQLESLTITTGSEAAELDFAGSLPVRYRLRYGQAEALEDGIVETVIYKREHTIVLSDLMPDTTYFYELYATDRFGRDVVLQKATFATTQSTPTADVINLEYFAGTAIGDDAILRWRIANRNEVAFVRIVRNERFFPQSPTDGLVVYEGGGMAYADIGAFVGIERQFYTLFAYTLSGTVSSGRVLQVDTVPQATAVVNPDTEDSAVNVERPVPTATSSTISAAAFSIRQQNKTYTLQDRQFSIAGETPFSFRVDAGLVPQFTRSVMVTIFETKAPEHFFTYVLRLNDVTGWYEARLPGLATDAEHSFVARMYSMSGKILDEYEGSIVLAPATSAPTAPESLWQLSAGYLLVGILLGVLVVGVLAFLVRLIFRRPQHT